MSKVLKIYEPLASCRCAMLFKNGTRIADYGDVNDLVTIDVCGDVEAEYNGTVYHSVSEMPYEVVMMLNDPKERNKFTKLHRNYFRVHYGFDYHKGDEEVVFPDDLSLMSADKLRDVLDQYLERFRKNRH